MDIGAFCRLDDLVHGSAGFSVGDVVPDRTRKEIHILLDHADLASEAFQRQGAHIFSVDGDLSAGHIVEPGKKRADRCLPASGRAYQGDGFPGRDLDGYMGQDRGVVVAVMEGYVFIADPSFYIFQRPGIRGILDFRLCLHDIQEAAESGKAFLHHFNELYEDLDRADEDADIKGVHGEIPCIHETSGDQVPAEYQCDKIHHALEEKVPSHKTAHAVVVVFL